MSRSFSWIPRHVSPIGLDLGTRVVRMLQLEHHKGQTIMTCYAQRELPAGVEDRAQCIRLQDEAVRDMLARERFVGRRVNSTLSWDELHIRNLRIPAMPVEEVGEAIRFEAADRLGLDAGQAEIRFIIAGDVRQGTDIRQEVLVMASSGQAVEAHISRLHRLGLEPATIDAGPCAIFRGFERFLRRNEDVNTVNAFVDLGYAGTRVLMSRGPELTFYKSIPVGGRRFDELVAEKMDMELAQAAGLRVRVHRQHVAALTGQQDRVGEELVGEDMCRALLDALRPALDQLSKEIALCLRYCSVTFRGPRSNTVTVLGGEACNRDILQWLTDQTHVPFQIGKPMRNIALESEYSGADRRTGSPEWSTVLGLALKPAGKAVMVEA